jgi:hypothetical protein
MIRRLRRIGIVLLAAGSLAACLPFGGRPPSGSEKPPAVPGRVIGTGLPPGEFLTPVWMPDGWVYFAYRPKTEKSIVNDVWRVRPEGGQAELVRLEWPAGCARHSHGQMRRLPDNRLGVGRDCINDDPYTSWEDYAAYGAGTGPGERLSPVLPYPPFSPTWLPDLSGAYIEIGDICASIAPMSRERIKRFSGPATIDGHSWRLDQEFFGGRLADDGRTWADSTTPKVPEDCRRDGRASAPALLPSTSRLAFMASPASIGRSGWARLDQPWNLYVWPLRAWDQPDGQPRRVAGAFFDGLQLLARADGRHVILNARERMGGPRKLWEIDLDSGSKRVLASAFTMHDVALAPDERHLIFTVPKSNDTDDLFDMSMRVMDFGPG